jgi:N-methylhydantoinase A
VFFYEEAAEADVPIYLGESLPAATTLIGPAIIEYTGTTVVVGPNQSAHRDAGGNLRLDLGLASTERTQA